jgi:sulfur transfer protein SufE
MSNTNEESYSVRNNLGSNKKPKAKNEIFYVKKRGLFRKAEQVVRQCNSDIFIVVHSKENDKIYTYTNDEKFNL